MHAKTNNALNFLIGIFAFVIVIYAIVALFIPSYVHASLLPICTATGNCGICDIVSVGITIGKWLITGAGGLALLVIVWAAFGFVTSAGNAEKIQASKKQITGAILGMAIALLAFQLVMIIIFILATPSGSQTFEASQSENKTEFDKALKQGGLSRFLGVAWWTICDAADLRKAWDGKKNKYEEDKEYKGTGVCRFWGDGTPCAENNKKICISGKCIDAKSNNADLKAHFEKLTIPIGEIKDACGYLAKVDPEYEGYRCTVHDENDPNKQGCDVSRSIEKNLCPGDKTNVCCLRKTE
mgnify:CR=1 FL=1